MDSTIEEETLGHSQVHLTQEPSTQDVVSEANAIVASSSQNSFDGSEGVKRKTNQKITEISRKPPIQWVQRHSIAITMEIWQSIHEEQKLKRGEYAHHCINAINAFPNMSCVLRSNGYNISKGKFVIRFECCHPECIKTYQVRQIQDNNFTISDNDVECCHVEKRTRQVRGTEREGVREKLLTKHATSYKKQTEKEMNLDLYHSGNSQNVKSMSTLRNIRHEAIESFDYDRDDIIDVAKMKLIADATKQDVYIQRISFVPFAVTCFSRLQFDALRKLAAEVDDLTIYFDATGGVVRHGVLKIYYYAGVIAGKLSNEKLAKVIPVIQFINGKHDTTNIKIPLDEFKYGFHKMFPNDPWPIKYAVTDFSFASINALCYAWNFMSLIDYINIVFDNLDSKTNTTRISTFLILCVGHLSKTFAKDVDLYFPELSSTKQAILQEIFAGMCNCNTLNRLREIWTNLSALLLNKFANNTVHDALIKLATTMTKPYEKDESIEVPEEDRIPENERNETFDALYKQSKFYQYFKPATYKEDFNIQLGSQNAFYSIQFADVFLKKYLSIACLWTCVTQKERKANTYVEGHFKVTKEQLFNNAITIGNPPLKCGRFLRWMLEDLKSVANSFLVQIPSERLCGNKQQSSARKPRSQSTPTLLSLYRVTEHMKSSEAVENNDGSQSHTEEEYVGIDNLQVEESWNRKSKSKHSFFKQKALTKVASASSAELSKVLEEVPNKKSNKRNRSTTLRNHLIDRPQIYLTVEIDIVVACIGKMVLKRDDYRLLQANNHLNSTVIKFIFELFKVDHKDIQFETHLTESIISDSVSIVNITKNIFIGTLSTERQFCFIVIDSKKKTFSYVDPSATNAPEINSYYKSFLNFVINHNKKFKTKIPDDGWSLISLEYELQDNVCNSGICILNFVQQFLISSKISAKFDANEYRLELQHFVLRKASNMNGKCIMCGLKVPPNFVGSNVDWIRCCTCVRWVHIECTQLTSNEVTDATVTYICCICSASSV